MSATTAAADQPPDPFPAAALRSRSGRRQLRRSAESLTADPGDVTALIRLARRAARGDQERFARALLDLATAAIADRCEPAQARLAAAQVLLQLDAGDPGCDWREVTQRCLHLAVDPADPWTPDLVADATDVAFHRTLQFDSPRNPLAEDPEGFLAPFRANPAIRAALTRAPRTQPLTTEFTGYEAVLVSQGNTNFAAGVTRLLEREFSSTSSIDLAIFRQEFPPDSHDLIAAVVAGQQEQWWDTVDILLGQTQLVWAEWAQRQALVPSHALAQGPRLIVRLHAYEVFTGMAQFIDWRRVDALVVVSEAMANAARTILPLPPDLPVQVIGNHLDPDRFSPNKSAEARTTMALVGHNSQVKDPEFALDVLDLVRLREPTARLLLVGPLMTPTSVVQGKAAVGYTQRYLDRLQPYLDSGAVTVTGQTDDVPGALIDAGFILSTSRRESFHQGLLEGALSGCVAAVRDWPIMAPFGGPGSFLPERWVGTTPADLADRIVALMSDEEAWQSERMDCRAEAQAIVANPQDEELVNLVRGRDPSPGSGDGL